MILKADINGQIKKIPDVTVDRFMNGYRAFTIYGGEFAIISAKSDVAIHTLLGSCVALMIYDESKEICALNHFLLPTSTNGRDSLRFGLYSIESMINAMLKLGCAKNRFVAKIAGGARLIQTKSDIGTNNVEFARDFCKSEGIRVATEHVLGAQGRNLLCTGDMTTYIRLIDNNLLSKEIISKDEELAKVITRRQPDSSGVTLF